MQDVASVVGTWRAAFTEYRQELKFACEMESAGVSVYCPTEPRRVKVRGNWRDSTSPLFPNYVFYAATFDQDGWSREIDIACRTHVVVSTLIINNQRRFVEELAAVQRAIETDPTVTIYRDIPVGTEVRVKPPHSMKGTVGIVEYHEKKKCRLVLRVLGNAALAIELDADLVEPV